MAEAVKEKQEGWDRTLKHFGTFTNFRGVKLPAYLKWTDDGETKRGFVLLHAETHKEFKPGLLIMRPEHLNAARIKLELSGKTEPLEAAAPKAEEPKKSEKPAKGNK